MKGGFGNIMKQAAQMQQKMQRFNQNSQKTAEGTAGGGMVKVVANGKQEILSITINKAVDRMTSKCCKTWFSKQQIRRSNISKQVSDAMSAVTVE